MARITHLLGLGHDLTKHTGRRLGPLLQSCASEICFSDEFFSRYVAHVWSPMPKKTLPDGAGWFSTMENIGKLVSKVGKFGFVLQEMVHAHGEKGDILLFLLRELGRADRIGAWQERQEHQSAGFVTM